MSKGYSGLFEGTSGASAERGQLPLVTRQPNPVLKDLYEAEHTVRTVYGNYSTKIDTAKQGKHIPERKGYIQGRSILSISANRAQELVNLYAGTGTRVSENRERVDFHEIIGTYKTEHLADGLETSWGLIHYSKSGAHIVPCNPFQD